MTDDIPIDPATGQPYERRKDDAVLEQKKKELGARVDQLESNLTKFFIWGALFILAGCLVFGILFKIQGDQSDDIREQANTIQQERYSGYIRSCESQNESNREAKAKVLKLYPPGPEQNSRFETIDALRPFLGDCKVYADDRTGRTDEKKDRK